MTAAYPLDWPEGWPRTAPEKRTRANFKVKPDQIRRDLFNTLRLMGATNLVVSCNAPLRRDGTPLADVLRNNLDDPGIAVYFTYKDRQFVMARDAFKSPADNMRSLHWVIEGIRQIERHGGSKMMERAFAGFEALPPPGGWREDLGVGPDATEEDIKQKYRDLVKTHHPDHGGDPEQFQRINRAYEAAMREATQ